jgi:methyl-accepting chemotaxis protein
MKNKSVSLLSTVILLVFGLISIDCFALSKKELIAEVVHQLGYGGGIHQFKNYVLRGKEKYKTRSKENFQKALETLSQLSATGELSIAENTAVNDIKLVVKLYIDALDTVSDIRSEEKSLAKVLVKTDQKVKISDSKAVAGLELLRSAYQWKLVYEVEYLLGYGKAIHNFKNFLIRRQDKYRENAQIYYSEALKLISQLGSKENFDKNQLNAINNLQRTVQQYSSSLPVIKKTLAPSMSSKSITIINIAIRGADRSIKISDSSAIAAIELLKK